MINTSNISLSAIGLANDLLEYSHHLPNSYWFILSLLMIIFWISGNKLRKFTRPGSPKLSLFVKEMAGWFKVAGIISSTVIFLNYTIILALVWVGFSLAGVNHSNAPSQILLDALGAFLSAVKPFSIYTLSGLCIGLVMSVYINLFLITQWTRGEGLHDIRVIIKKYKKLNGYDPLKYIDVKLGCFVGLDFYGKPIYVPWRKIHETHIQILGSTGSGKGVMMCLIAYQSALAGECVIWHDPKGDSFSQRIMKMAAKRAGKDFHILNLNLDQKPQFNLLADMREDEIEELLVAGFDLVNKGSDGDYHRAKDEDAAILAAEMAINNDAKSIPALIERCFGEDEITQQENFWRKLKKLAGLKVINTSTGLNLKEAINKGSIIYVVGSTDNERVKMLQKMVLVRVMQIIKSRERSNKTKHVCVILDEFKHILSRSALTGLGAIRDFNSHFILAHQSLGDLDSSPGVTRSEAEGAVLDNTSIKIIYRLGNYAHAEQISKLSGKRPIFVEHANKNLDINKADSGGWKETHVPLIDPDYLTSLPISTDKVNQPSVGVLIGFGETKIFYVHYIKAFGDNPIPNPAPEYQKSNSVNSKDLI